MGQYDDLRKALTYLLTQALAPMPRFTRGRLGNGRGKIQVPDRPDYSYVRPFRSSDDVVEIFNKEVTGGDGTPVLIGELPWQPGMTQIVGVDWETYAAVGWGAGYAGVARHGETHVWRDGFVGTDSFNIYRRQIAPLRTYPLGSGSQSVFVAPYDYLWDGSPISWCGLPGLDLSAATPVTGTARLMLTYLDMESNVCGVVTGSIDVYSDAIELARPALPTGTWFPSAYVRIYGGQGSISERDIWDARQLWASPTARPSGPAGGDLTGTYPNPTVRAIQGQPISPAVPSEGDHLIYTGSMWQPLDPGGMLPTGPAGGDLTGSYPDPNVAGLFGYSLSNAAPSEGEALIFTGSIWQPMPLPSGYPPVGAAGGDLTGTYPDPLVVGIYGDPILSDVTPAEGNVLVYSASGTNYWRPADHGYLAGLADDDHPQYGWPFITAGLSVDTAAAGAGYSTIAAAIAALGASEQILASPETHTCDNQTLLAFGTLSGLSRDLTTLQTTTQTITLTLNASCFLSALRVNNSQSNAAAIYAVRLNGSLTEIRDVIALADNTNAGGSAHAGAYRISGANINRLTNCDGIATVNGGNGYAILTDGDGCTLIVEGGRYDGETYDIQVAATDTVYLFGPTLVNGTINNSGALKGWYYDGAGDLYTVGGADLRFTSATGENTIRVPDNLADALHIVDAGDANDYLTVISTDAQREVAINQDGADIDFRVEGIGQPNALFIRGSDGKVGMGLNAPTTKLHVYDTGIPVECERYVGATGSASAAFKLHVTTAYNMVDGFGANTNYVIEDVAGVENTICVIATQRDGADNSGKISFYTASAGSLAPRIIALSGGNVGIGTSAPGQILDVNQGSGNMIADGYDNHSLAKWKGDIRPVSTGDFLRKLRAIPLYDYRRVPFVSTEELIRAAERNFGIVLTGTEPFIDARTAMERIDAGDEEDLLTEKKLRRRDIKLWIAAERDRLREQRRGLPRWQRRHVGLVADDPILERELPGAVSRDATGNVVGYSLNEYVGFLHGCILELEKEVRMLKEH